ncbi:MAG: TDP-N-acetylfucosamine:lipid II N-acetylfucosaminyltransferase [Halopseudomonas sp.]
MASKKNLHLVHDDKFIDMAYRVFESVYPGGNHFISFSNSKVNRYIKKAPVVIYSIWSLVLYRFFPFFMPKYDVVFVHGLDSEKLQYLRLLGDGVKICWIGWGYDYYDYIDCDLLKSKTKNYEYEVKGLDEGFFCKCKNYLRSFVLGRVDKESILNRVDCFAPVLYEDYELLKRNIEFSCPKYIDWNYGTLEEDWLDGFGDGYVDGDNILLGNSATNTNNHLDSFELIKNIGMDGSKIIVPLSYGDCVYRDIVIREGEAVFGNRFCPLVDFLQIDEYIKLISSCSIVVMNHVRQQAVGNIVIMLYLGAKVFLDKKNPVYLFLKRQGVMVFNLDELHYESRVRLDLSDVEVNRSIIRKHWGRDVIYKKTKNLVESLRSS